MNGAVIGIAVAIIHQAHLLIPPVPHLALAACTVAVVGPTLRTTAECRIATTTTPTFATTTLGFV